MLFNQHKTNEKVHSMIIKGNRSDTNVREGISEDAITASSCISCRPDTSLCRRSHLLPLLLLFALLFVSYSNSFNGTWIFDDNHNILQNQYVHLKSLDWKSINGTFFGTTGNFSRPLSYLSFGLNYYFHQLDVFGYHLINFIIHCISTLFLYLFIFHVLHLPIMKGQFSNRAGSIALLSATLWTISPIQVTAITVIVQRMASMAGMFFIMAMFFYLMGRVTPGLEKKIKWFSLCFLSGLLSLASKENAAMLPIVLYFFDVLLIQGVSRTNIKRHLIITCIPLGIILILAFVLSTPSSFLSSAAYANREFTLTERLLTQPRVLLFYLSLMIYPITNRFTLIYDIPISTSLLSPWTTLPAILFWAAWIGTGIYLARKRPLISFCLLFFIINHIIESSFIALELIFEHRNYIPSMMLFFLASVGIMSFINDFSKKFLPTALAIILLCFFITAQGHTVFQRNSYFENALFLWDDNAKKSPLLSRVHTNLGLEYYKIGMRQESSNAYQTAIKVNRYQRRDEKSVPFTNLANHYLHTGNKEDALNLYRQAIANYPSYLPAKQGMAVALLVTGDIDKAKILIERTIASGRANLIFFELYSLVLCKKGDYANAIIQAQHAVLNTKDIPLLANKVLGEAYTQLRQYDQAHKYWLTYAKDYPNELEPLFALAYLSHKRNDEETARSTAQKIMYLKGSKSWNELSQYANHNQTANSINLIVFSEDPEKVLFLVKQTIKKEISENEKYIHKK